MKKLVFLLSLLFIGFAAIAQQTEEKDTVIFIVEEMPEYPGGLDEMIKFISKNVKYPKEERNSEIQGTVIVSFVIEKDGSVSNAKVVRSVSPGLDAEALRVINLMPAWKPGKQKGEEVRVQFNLPINFTLYIPENKDDKTDNKNNKKKKKKR